MSTFKERLEIEKCELDEKKAKLQSFITGESFNKVDPIQQTLLNIQLSAMATYSMCLGERLEWLNRI